ncbi:sulfhydrogenase subunit delta [Oceanimonas sp. CHS3-5]|uniref:NADH-quinone oxidoreductase subunit B family protein n=1 Tax=Oceanimonas sp. CHS3-5 TaxID=3068186 RepID=UPI00273EC0DC|nr:sulfhydrogenase subunit delta [Oceanimonas sp. CHS3-5]MDP5291385.1 sulfhydrogenase subunit delta [Oceanimonas sp. CHS3-5]
MSRPRLTLAVHKLTSCSGCQLALLNQGPALLALLEEVEFVHFIEAGIEGPDKKVDLALVEGSISTPEDLARAKALRRNSRLVVTMGACATSGGIQALRNMADGPGWKAAIYAHPDFIATLDTSTGVAEHIRVDFELWGCPITLEQMRHFLRQLRLGVQPRPEAEKLCMECKRRQQVCVMVTKGAPCLGPVVRTGCGALCPAFGRACYGCFGPSELPNCDSLANRFTGLGLLPDDIARRFAAIHSHSAPFREQVLRWQPIDVREVDE